MKNFDFGFVFLVIGAIVGAGFSSGKEIAVFFSGAGKYSFIIIVFVTIFLYYLLKTLLKLGKVANTNNIKKINKILFKKNSKYFDIFILIGLFIFVTAMIAGLNSVGRIIFKNIDFPVLSIVSVFFAMFICLIGYDGIKKVNKVLVPIVVCFVFMISIFSLFTKNNQSINLNMDLASFVKFFMLGIFYISYNVVFSSSLIVTGGKDLTKKKIRQNSGAISSIIGILILVINLALLNLKFTDFYFDLPLLKIAFNIHFFVGYMFSFVLWFSIITSLISSLYMLINAFKINKILSCSIILSLAFFLSFFGFSYIVNLFYPLQGLIGVIFIIKVIIFDFKNDCEILNTTPQKSKPKKIKYKNSF